MEFDAALAQHAKENFSAVANVVVLQGNGAAIPSMAPALYMSTLAQHAQPTSGSTA
jgi:hypothetical protein